MNLPNQESMMSLEELGTLVGLCFTMLTLVGSCFWYVHTSLAAVEKTTGQRNELAISKESAARAELASLWQRSFEELRKGHEALALDAVRRADLKEVEQRLMTAFRDAEQKSEAYAAQLGQDMKHISEQLIRLLAIQSVQSTQRSHGTQAGDNAPQSVD